MWCRPYGTRWSLPALPRTSVLGFNMPPWRAAFQFIKRGFHRSADQVNCGPSSWDSARAKSFFTRHSSFFNLQSRVSAMAAGKDQALGIGAGAKREALHDG